MRIAVASVNGDVRGYVSRKLTACGALVHTYDHPDALIEVLGGETFDVIFLCGAANDTTNFERARRFAHQCDSQVIVCFVYGFIVMAIDFDGKVGNPFHLSRVADIYESAKQATP